MELKDFVSKTIMGIIEGVRDAQILAREYDAFVNPADTGVLSVSKTIMAKDNDNITFLQRVDFSLSLMEYKSIDGGVGIKVAKIGGEQQNTIENKVSFSVPLVLPTDRCKRH
ncbi:hypothetical protein [Xylanibacter rodentium]|jgi:hypothetical protein|uniref:hypothetical protein n=1 Tax=Xylanibacter rodentium TaxID=2736289 RepID=UPI002583432D|nr:hypothetical protein [Xylanibacter rodentium]